MDKNEKTQFKALRLAGSGVLLVFKAFLYFLSFLGPVLVISHWRSLPVTVLLALALVGYGFAGSVFHVLLVLTKKLVVGPVRITGAHTINTKEMQRWFLASALMGIQQRSLFRYMTVGLSLWSTWFYRGMGAKMPDSTLLGTGSVLLDPWFLEAGDNVNIGAGAVILGHLGHGKEILLGKVTIAGGAVVGTRAIILPDVHIGRDARVAAGAVVTRGTIIGDGEIWGGVPARKIGPKAPAA